MTTADRAVYERHLAAGCKPIVFGGSQHLGDPEHARRLCEAGLAPAHRAEIEAQLDALEPRLARQRAWQAEEDVRDADKARPMADWEKEQGEQVARQADEAAKRRASSEGRAERQIELLERIADALDKRGRP